MGSVLHPPDAARLWRRVLLAVTALALLSLFSCGGRAVPAGSGPGTASVVRVVDGDTLVVRIGATEERVRLLGIDTPESVDPRAPVECFGKEASEHTAALLPAGTQVRLVRDVEARDRYSRLLAYVYRVDDGTFVNLELVAGGFASVLTYPPNVAHAEEFNSAAADARREGRGLWSSC